MSNNIRDKIVIDLDLSFNEWNKLYPIMPKLKNNPWSNSAFSKQEIEDMEIKQLDGDKIKGKEKIYFSPIAIPMDLKPMIKEKEFVISEGMTIYVNISDQIKEKKIRRLIINEKGDKREFTLEFENTLKLMPLILGMQFIIKPQIKNKEFLNLMGAFDLNENAEVCFQGPITKLSYYKKEKTKTTHKLGIIISPNFFIELSPIQKLAA
jgi:hypothetical protein